MDSSDSLLTSFSHLQIDNTEALDEAEGRSTCPVCQRSRKYYCYTCYCVMPRFQHITPRVQLPIHIDIIKHRLERDGKSTACHAAVISPGQVHIHTFPDFPDLDVDKTVLVFPGKDAVQLEDLISPVQLDSSPACSAGVSESSPMTNGHTVLPEPDTQQTTNLDCDTINGTTPCDTNNSSTNTSCVRDTNHCALTTHNSDSAQTDLRETVPMKQETSDRSVPCPAFQRVVFIDATWNQVHGMMQDERLNALKKVELRARHSRFWRHQKGTPPTYLSTIEAVYYFLCDYHQLFVGTPYTGQYDNLLFFFSHLCQKVNIAKDERIRIKKR